MVVDPTKGIGPVQNVTSISKPQNVSNKERSEEKREAEEKDKVEISEEALNLVQAQEKAEETRQQLEENRDATLGLDPNFDEDQ